MDLQYNSVLSLIQFPNDHSICLRKKLLKKQTEYDKETLEQTLQKKQAELEASFLNEPVPRVPSPRDSAPVRASMNILDNE
jgi:hypothetical protein